jgi:hypothetical protein
LGKDVGGEGLPAYLLGELGGVGGGGREE